MGDDGWRTDRENPMRRLQNERRCSRAPELVKDDVWGCYSVKPTQRAILDERFVRGVLPPRSVLIPA